MLSPSPRRSFRLEAGAALARASARVPRTIVRIGLVVAVLGAAALPFSGAGERPFDVLDSASAQAPGSIDLFYGALTPYGAWVRHPNYGPVFIPAKVSPEWRPYTVGQWRWTDGFGWLWDSDEPFGWATYHYGRWSYEPSWGWFWVPGNEWSPAWVAWRSGDDSVGWAALAPDRPGPAWGFPTRQKPAVPEAWVFVPTLRFAQPKIYLYAAPVRETFVSLDRAPLSWSYSANGPLENRPFDRNWLRRHNGQYDVPAKAVKFVHDRAEIAKAGDAIALYRPWISDQPGDLPPPPKLLDTPADAKRILLGERADPKLVPQPRPGLKYPRGTSPTLPPHAKGKVVEPVQAAADPVPDAAPAAPLIRADGNL